MNRFRRILVRWEKRQDTFLAMLHLVCGIITWRGCDLLGQHLHRSLASSAAWRFNLSELGALGGLAVQSS
jgi:hypothetical protein